MRRMEIPPPSAEAIARSLFAAELGATRLSIGAETQRAWARKRVRAAWGALPLFVALGVGALVVSTNLTLIAVICGFMAYACVSLARQADRELRTASAEAPVYAGVILAVVGAAWLLRRASGR
jgi:hypothetical protein